MRIISPKLPRFAAIRRSRCLKDERLIHTRIEVKLPIFPPDIYPRFGIIIYSFVRPLMTRSNFTIISELSFIQGFDTFRFDFLKKDSKLFAMQFDKYKGGQQQC